MVYHRTTPKPSSVISLIREGFRYRILLMALCLLDANGAWLPKALAENVVSSKTEKSSPGQGGPVTDASVEAGLRKTREALRQRPEFQSHDPETHMRLATLLNQQGDPNGAIEEYRMAIQLDPNWAKAYRDLGAVYIDKHEWKAAIQALQHSIQLDEDDGQAWYWLGRARMATQDFPGATEALDMATAKLPMEPQAYSDLGLVLMAQGYAGKGEKALQQAIHLQPDFAEAHHRLELLQAGRDNQEHLKRSAAEILNILFRRE